MSFMFLANYLRLFIVEPKTKMAHFIFVLGICACALANNIPKHADGIEQTCEPATISPLETITVILLTNLIFGFYRLFYGGKLAVLISFLVCLKFRDEEQNAKIIESLSVCHMHAYTEYLRNYCRPEIHNQDIMHAENLLNSNNTIQFVSVIVLTPTVTIRPSRCSGFNELFWSWHLSSSSFATFGGLARFSLRFV